MVGVSTSEWTETKEKESKRARKLRAREPSDSLESGIAGGVDYG